MNWMRAQDQPNYLNTICLYFQYLHILCVHSVFSSYSAFGSNTITAILYACTIFSQLNLHFHMNVTSKHTHTSESIRNIFFFLIGICYDRVLNTWARNEFETNTKLKRCDNNKFKQWGYIALLVIRSRLNPSGRFGC